MTAVPGPGDEAHQDTRERGGNISGPFLALGPALQNGSRCRGICMRSFFTSSLSTPVVPPALQFCPSELISQIKSDLLSLLG